MVIYMYNNLLRNCLVNLSYILFYTDKIFNE